MLTNFINSPIIFSTILTLGLVFALIELFVPNLGILGIIGVYLIFESILAMKNIQNVGIYVSFSIILSFLIVFVILKLFASKIKKGKFVLNTNLTKSKSNILKNDLTDLLGKEGIVHKTLRPYGEIKIEDNIYEATCNGDFIVRDSKIKVEKIEGTKIICSKID